MIKSSTDIEKLKEGGMLLATIFKYLESKIEPGISLIELDSLSAKKTMLLGGEPAFLNYEGFPFGLCASVNEVVVHGLPSEYKLREGDIVGLDYGLKYKGMFTDMARTYPVGNISSDKRRLLSTTKKCLELGISQARPGNTIGDIGYAVEKYAISQGFSVVRTLVGHGVGYKVHEEPKVPNYGQPGEGVKLEPGMVLAIEPMVNMGKHHVKTAVDGFSVVTVDGQVAAHFENTIVITNSGAEILTKL